MSKIEWTDATWNPTTGCDKVSPGCKHCYAEVMSKRLKAMGQAKYRNDFKLTFHDDALDAPLHWRKPRMCFVNSMSDLFHKSVTNEQIAAVFGVMAACPQHQFQILTKRAERLPEWFEWAAALKSGRSTANQTIAACSFYTNLFAATDLSGDSLLWCMRNAATWPLPNVWLGTTVESAPYTHRIDDLRRTPAAVRFLSLEPLLGPLPGLDLSGIDWVIVGAESGHGARPMDEDWVRGIRDQCGSAGVAFFYKQRLEGRRKVSIPELDGKRWEQMPEVRP